MSTEPKVYFYKPKDNHDEYKKELASVNACQNKQLVSTILSKRPGVGSCVLGIAMNQKKSQSGPDIIENLYISPTYSDAAPLCMNSTSGLKNDSYFRILNCQNNFMSGKCVCPYMKLVGEILFPQIYNKEKTR